MGTDAIWPAVQLPAPHRLGRCWRRAKGERTYGLRLVPLLHSLRGYRSVDGKLLARLTSRASLLEPDGQLLEDCGQIARKIPAIFTSV